MKGDHEKAALYFQRALRLNKRLLAAWTLLGHEYVEVLKNIHIYIMSTDTHTHTHTQKHTNAHTRKHTHKHRDTRLKSL